MKYIGYDDFKINKIFDQMRILDSYHSKAGRQIRNKIIQIIRKSNFDDLNQSGFQEFELEETGAKLGLFAIQEIEKSDVLIPSSMCDRAIDIDNIDD